MRPDYPTSDTYQIEGRTERVAHFIKAIERNEHIVSEVEKGDNGKIVTKRISFIGDRNRDDLMSLTRGKNRTGIKFKPVVHADSIDFKNPDDVDEKNEEAPRELQEVA